MSTNFRPWLDNNGLDDTPETPPSDTSSTAKEELIKRLDINAPPSIQEVLEDLMKKQVEFDVDKAGANDDDTLRSYEENRSITKFINDVGKNWNDLKKKYRENMWKEKELPKWLLNLNDLWAKFPHLLDIIKALYKYSKPMPERRRDKSLIAKDSIERRKNKGHLPVCFIANKKLFDKILPELGIKQITLQHYIIGLQEVGAIKKIDKKGFIGIPYNETLYCVGYRYEYLSLPLTNWLLTQKLKKKLCSFKLPSSNKHYDT